MLKVSYEIPYVLAYFGKLPPIYVVSYIYLVCVRRCVYLRMQIRDISYGDAVCIQQFLLQIY